MVQATGSMCCKFPLGGAGIAFGHDHQAGSGPDRAWLQQRQDNQRCALQELGKYGTLYIEVTYHPFVSPEKQEQMQKQIEEARRKTLEVCLPAQYMLRA
jgi:hypothetical protein